MAVSRRATLPPRSRIVIICCSANLVYFTSEHLATRDAVKADDEEENERNDVPAGSTSKHPKNQVKEDGNDEDQEDEEDG